MRARNLKPGFFKNEDLAECEPLARILFSGLWCMADRDGRLECRPKRIRAEVLPYDNCNIEKLLKQLSDKKFIIVYSVNNENYIEILNFGKHQNPHCKEAESTIPAPDKHHTSTVQAPDKNGSRPAESLLLNPDSGFLNPEKESAARFSSPPEKTKKQKNKYADSVYLTDDEHKKLQEVMGQKNLEAAIEQLDYSITVKSGKYKDHYKTLLNWHKRGFLDATSNRQTARAAGTYRRTDNAARDAINAEACDAADEIRRDYEAKLAASNGHSGAVS